MPTITVLTPVHDGGDAYLAQTRESIASQHLPAGWDLQWVVQEDGQTGRPLSLLPDEPWISKGQGRAGGAARARSVALPRAEGVLLRCLDADDLFPDDEVLARDINTLTEHPDRGWCVCPCLDLYPDGSLHPGPYDPAPGPLRSGFLLDSLRASALPVMGTTMTAYTELVRVVGGWPALPAFEDAALLLACDAVADGWMQEKPGEIYRKHEGQSTAATEYRDADERTVRLTASIERAAALQRTGWRWAPANELEGEL